jgi:hypothetical protein
MPAKLATILTVGPIARRLGEPLHCVEYAIKSRSIEPCGIAGKLRVFDEDAVAQIAAALHEIKARQNGGAA